MAAILLFVCNGSQNRRNPSLQQYQKIPLELNKDLSRIPGDERRLVVRRSNHPPAAVAGKGHAAKQRVFAAVAVGQLQLALTRAQQQERDS